MPSILPTLADGGVVAIGHHVAPAGMGITGDKLGQVVDYSYGLDADVEVLWLHLDTTSWWPADKLVHASDELIARVA